MIVTTANDDFDLVRQMLSLKVDDYLLKPVKQSTLSDTIRKTLPRDDQEAQATREMCDTISTLITRCDYPGWHTFLFSILDAASTGRIFGSDHSGTLTDALTLVARYLASLGDNYAPCQQKIQELTQMLSQQGLTAGQYWRVMNRLLTLSAGIFDLRFRQASGEMDFVARARFHIERNILTNLTLDDIAAKAFVSPCYLSRAFKKACGTGFSSYITGRKIAMAKSLLQFSDLKVNTLALELSWQDANYFCRIFKKETGIAPSDYRNIAAAQTA